MPGFWRLFADTGGTFTDCLGIDDAGVEVRAKVLSSGRLTHVARHRGGAMEIVAPSLPAGFFSGCRVATAIPSPSQVTSSNLEDDGETHLLHFSEPLPETLERLTLDTGREAPLVGAHILTGTPLDRPLPRLALRLATTRATNALLESRGARVALFTNAGLGDLLRIGDQTRPDLFALHIERPKPLHAAVVEVSGRLDAQGNVLVPNDLDSLRQQAQPLLERGIDTACVALLHSYRNPAHETQIAAALRRLGFRLVVTSCEISPRIHLGRRAETTLVDAYLGPLMESYLSQVEGALTSDSPLRIMTSAGGLVPRSRFRPIDSLLSGPAGGVVGAATAAQQAGCARVLCFDMGGTSTDVSRFDGSYHYQHQLRVGNARLQGDALHIETVAAGGGSICHLDQGAFKVGPQSAGANPGPACYGNGGPLTLTDAQALLGRLSPEQFAIPLDLDAAQARWEAFLEEHALPQDGAISYLEGFLQIANERMADTIRSISVREGEDPADYALLAFGGAGGLHACALAELLGCPEILIPQDAGILSARGLEQASLEAQHVLQVLQPWETALPRVEDWIDQLTAQGLEETGLTREECVIECEGALRFLGQEATLSISFETTAEVPTRFRREYARIFGHLPERALELESLRVRLRETSPARASESFADDPVEATASSLTSKRHRMWTAQGWQDVVRIDAATLAPETLLTGPLLVTSPHYTLVVEDGWHVEQGSLGTLRLRRTGRGSLERTERPPEVLLELFTQRFRNVVQVMGDQLKKTALSTNVKERLDYSCCLLDPQGRLIANAPHIPVHLGAMGLCVRRVMETLSPQAGDVYLTNHPAYGGSHLPDLTVIMPVFSHDQRTLLGYVANRAHHAEMGGIRPGSMPPNATSLEEEGVILPPLRLFDQGVSQEDAVREHLLSAPFPTRAIEENLADLRAQVASCRAGAALLRDLAEKHGLTPVTDQMQALYQLAANCALASIRQHLPEARQVSEALDDGSRIQVAISPTQDHQRLHLDFTGTSLRHPANLHATPAIVRSALVYVIRLLQSHDLPLNEGLLDAVEVVLPHCFLNPDFSQPPLPPVVGGNVETSQRLVDTLLKAFDLAACSQGTMNNLIFGDADISYYETIAGGAGATAQGPGASAVHTHMTNTAITDPEILEWRYPVRLRRFAIRSGSGGQGHHCGGEGIIREFEFLRPLSVSMLTQHRQEGPYGAHGGGPGSPGSQQWIRGEQVTPLPSLASFEVAAQDRLVVHTPGGGGWGHLQAPPNHST